MDINRYDQLAEAIEAERKHEENYFAKLSKSKSIQQRIDSGVLWWPVIINKSIYTISEFVEVEIERKRLIGSSHKMRVGKGIRIFKEGRDSSYNGVISWVRRDKLKVLLRDDRFLHDNDIKYGNVGIELTYDERPYKIMRQALMDLKTTKDPFYISLKNNLLQVNQASDLSEKNIPENHLSDRLNQSQKTAIVEVTKAGQVAVIHGPPGTGKTTTLVEMIVQLAKIEKKILVCAPSNNAVDLIAGMLDQRNVSVLRVGNISRIGDELLHLSLEDKMRAHPDWKHIKKVRIEAEEAKKMAGQHKRSFGESQRRERKDMYKESKELRKWARELEDRLNDVILGESKVICTTLIGASHKSINFLRYNTCIIDEASQTLEPACWNVMLKSRRTIFSGDHKQLPPVVKSDKAKELGLGITLLDRLAGKIKFDHLLNIQYRMHQDILEFSNKRHYKGQLLSHISVRNKTIPESPPVTFIDTSGCGFYEEFNTQKKSYINSQEYYLLREYILTQKEKQLPYSIGLISPYSSQVQFIRTEIAEDDDLKGLNIEVDTIDGFQGQEKDIMYISLVRSNDQGNVGFLSDERRLNVAMTRAKMILVIIGDLTTLSQHPLYRDLTDFIEKNNYYKSAWEYMSY